MAYRFLGESGLKVSEVVYGNWLTHGSQVENDTATACVRAALDAGITSFDTADVYADGVAESVLGAALRGEPRESLEIFTKVYFPVGRRGPNDTGLSRKHIREGIDGSLRRLGVDYVDLYQAHRFDHETPLEETIQAFADVVRQGKALYIGVSEWTEQELREGQELARQAGFRIVSNQPQYSMLWRVIESRVVPASRVVGISQIVWSPMAQGVLSGKYLPGQAPPAGSRATDDKGGDVMIKGYLRDEVLAAVQGLRPIADGLGITMPQLAIAWVLANDNVSAALVGATRPEQIAENVKALEVRLTPEVLIAIDHALGGPDSELIERDPARTKSPSHRLGGVR
ncbi:aldo/keto reductase family protein [Tomitella biformata]|uniref:aldo/keto reductase family protein n=1 Tax=Tomitella biformata TaxID=630403 RepID=UPI0004646572|nr:aldo/keto reductase family protein [Tomitella biformata]